jgi:ABC-type amino acid transport substrate-binding protein
MRHLLTLLITCLLTLPAAAEAPAKESAFEHILRTGVISCGYYVFPPIVTRDVNTNAMSGFSVDFMNRLAERAGLKVEWTEEITFGNWVPAMQSRRFDMVCTPMWPELTHARVVAFTHSLFFSGLSPAVRADDPRFTSASKREQLNSPDYTMLTQEGNSTDAVARAAFPNATFYTLSAEAGTANYYQDLLNKKADAVLTDRNGLREFNKANAGEVVRLLEPDNPIKLQSFPLVVNRGETELRDFINLAIEEMTHTGEIDRILRKHEAEPGLTYLRRAKAFDTPN